MGSWNGTCGISNLPILYGEPIRLCLIVGHTYKLADDNLVRNPGSWLPDCDVEWVDDQGNKYKYADREGKRTAVALSVARKDENDRWRQAWYSRYCYASDVFFPRCVPLKGKYDSYGGITAIEDSINVTAVLDQFQLDLDEYPAGKFDIPVKISKDMPLSDLLKAIERGGVTVNRYKDDRPHNHHHHLPVATWMVREDIYQAMIKTKIGDRWGDGVMDIHNFYEDAETYRSELREQAEKEAAFDEILRHSAGRDAKFSLIREYQNRNSGNRLRESMHSPPFENGLSFYDDWLTTCVSQKRLNPDDEKVKSFIREIADFSFFCLAKETMRVGWMAQPGAGSQDENIDVHAAVAEQMLKTISKRREEWAFERALDEAEEE